MLSLIVGIGAMISWCFMPKIEIDWLTFCFTDLIAVCMVIGSIKFLKIRSLRIVVLTLLVNEAVNFIMSMILMNGNQINSHYFF